MDQVDAVLQNGFAAALDIPGFNYRVHKYLDAYDRLPQKLILGSETSSTVSSRGVYKFPVSPRADAKYSDHQSSSYDTEYCSWSNMPDYDLAMAEDYRWEIGQFVWSGFDYLGEPSPYDTDAWPSHSSLFGIIDLASIPKDRYYLYRSLWNPNEPTLHVLPHWNWEGREAEITPVFVYTSYPSAELFVNGKSQGVRTKSNATVMERFRLMWNDVVYEAGELRVVAYDSAGNIAEQKVVRTASEPYALRLVADRNTLNACGDDLAFVKVTVVDRFGNEVPIASNLVNFGVEGAGRFRAVANGDPTSLFPFGVPEIALFSGAATLIVGSVGSVGTINLTASSEGLEPATLQIEAR